MSLLTSIFGDIERVATEVAELANVPADRRGDFCEKLVSWMDAGNEYGRLELLANWKALSHQEQKGVENIRNKLVAAYNAALALTPAQKKCVDDADWIATLKKLTAALNTCTNRTLPQQVAKRRPKGRTQAGWIAHDLIKMVEGCGGKLPSIDYDADTSTINRIITILKPHLPEGDLRPVSAATFRRVKKERKALRK